jgi:hypothetical protein
MDEQDIFFGLVADGKTINVEQASRQIAEYVFAHGIRPYSETYKEFRTVCLRRLTKFPKEQVRQLAETLLINYDLRVLGYDLVYYHNFSSLASPKQEDHYH